MGLEKLEGLRNVAIVAHVDHGKTTLVDAMLKEAEVFRANEAVEERVMDSNDQERERGITILAKNAAVEYKGVKINVVDTPGHADFGGEVERILNMVDGVLLVVDSAFDLFVELDANDEQTDFSIVYAGAQGKSGVEPDDLQDNMAPILDAIIESIPPPMVDREAQLLVANIDIDFKGSGIGAPSRGAGRIVMFSGVSDIMIGETVVAKDAPLPMEPLEVEEPTVSMSFAVNKSPLAGKEGDKLTSRVIRDRLMKELDRNVALQVEPQDSGDAFKVIIKDVDGVKSEPFDALEIQVPDEYASNVVDLLNRRKGEMTDMGKTEATSRVKYLLPTRSSIGLRTNMLSATRGTAVIDSNFDSYRPFAGDPRREGDRGQLFATPKTSVYKDMIVGVHQRPGDLRVNICKQKQLTNMLRDQRHRRGLAALELTLDSAVEYITNDELVEVTPESIRMCKKPGWDKKGKGSAGPRTPRS
ncbi:GTPase [Aureococcus anophagefferens]|nr:GTPase [Aureococcus anophagefferens]